jgi:hypothetical protein
METTGNDLDGGRDRENVADSLDQQVHTSLGDAKRPATRNAQLGGAITGDSTQPLVRSGEDRFVLPEDPSHPGSLVRAALADQRRGIVATDELLGVVDGNDAIVAQRVGDDDPDRTSINTLMGPVADTAALNGILARLEALGLALEALQPDRNQAPPNEP